MSLIIVATNFGNTACNGQKANIRRSEVRFGRLESVEPALKDALAARDFDRAVTICLPFAEKDDADAQFAIGSFLILKASSLRSSNAPHVQIHRVELEAISWIKRAAIGGNDTAKGVVQDINRFGNDAIYRLPVDHLLPREKRRKLVPITR